MIVKLNKNAVFLEFVNRVKANENGVRNYLLSAGMKVGDEGITIQQLCELQKINPQIFAEMCRFLYPEMKDVASADGDDSAIIVEDKSGSKWKANDWISLIGTTLNGASVILSGLNINGNTEALAAANAYAAAAAQEQAEREKKQLRNTIIIVCIGFLVITIAGVLIFKNRR